MSSGITVAIPSIPQRAHTLLPEAIASVLGQQLLPDAISVAIDHDLAGAWVTRQRALDAVLTEWTAFLDDDDKFYPEHLRLLALRARQSGADYVFSYMDVMAPGGAGDVFATYDEHGRQIAPGHFGKVFDPEHPHHTTMTVMVKTDLAKSVPFTPRVEGDLAGGEDWRFLLGCVAAGAKIVHLPRMTWFYRYRINGNTSGRPDMGDALTEGVMEPI